MLKHITFTFPNSTPSSQSFFEQLAELLSELPNSHRQEDGTLTINATKPLGALPSTIFVQSDVPFPQLSLDTSQELSLNAGNLYINPTTQDYETDNRGFERIITKQDSLGAYFELHASSQAIYRLSMSELVKRLKSHVVRIDHTGINLPSTLITDGGWEKFIHALAQQTNLYKYPTNDIWPFILPATHEEYETDITVFLVGREPKFELVYDTFSPVPTIQIDIETNLTRPQVERLFPEPYGVSFPDLADFFRTVYVHHEWLGLAIRFDIRFKSDQPGDWETGKWLVTDGGRI